jgi:hypothetical protein
VFLFSTASIGIPVGMLSQVKARVLSVRGGAGRGVLDLIKKLLEDVAASKTKSWTVLVMAILLETCASQLSKRARDTANLRLFLCALSLNILR